MGAIQITGEGQPIVLMADRQPTGGYPKIGTVIRADLPILAQTHPGSRVQFKSIAIKEAIAVLEISLLGIAGVKSLARERRSWNIDLLSSRNYGGGIVDAFDNPF